MNKCECRTTEFGTIYNGDWIVRFSVIETGNRNPFFKVKRYDTEEEYNKERHKMVSQFLFEENANIECRRLNKDAKKYPKKYKTMEERKAQ